MDGWMEYGAKSILLCYFSVLVLCVVALPASE